jgi:serine/threonine-protein kinase
MDNFVGKMLEGRYLVEELIGVGGMANVYRGYDTVERRTVAIKMLRDECAGNEEYLRRFRNESKAIYSLNHPNIVKLYDVLLDRRNPVIVMEYVEGSTLKDYISQRGVVSPSVAASLAIQLVLALRHAHDNGIVHRDVKPQNIIIKDDGSIKVMDFGIAQFSTSHTRTMTDRAIGSVHYISPEQARGEGEVDQRTDLYSTGVILFEMLTGRLPFEADSPVGVAIKQIEARALRPQEINPAIPDGLEDITVKAMCKDPDRRYQTAGEMLRDLEQFIQNPNVYFGYTELETAMERGSDVQRFLDDNSGPPRRGSREERGGRGGKNAASRRRYQEEEEDSPPPRKKKKRRRVTYLTVLFGITCAFVVGTLIFIGMMLHINKPFEKVPEDDCPQLVGQDLETAQKSNKKFVIEVESQEFNNQYPTGVIFEQTPTSGKRVKEGITIKVKVSTGNQELTMPDCIDQEAALVYAKLTGMGLDYVVSEETSPTIKEGNVTQTIPGMNEKVYSGDVVTVFVSTGTGKAKVAVPDVMTWDISIAQDTLAAAGLKASIKYEASTMDPGMVINQNPKSPARLDVGSTVYLTVASDDVVPTADYKLRVFFTEKMQSSGETYQISVTVDGSNAYTAIIDPAEQRAVTVPLSGEGLSVADVYVDGHLYQSIRINFEEGTSSIMADNSGEF